MLQDVRYAFRMLRKSPAFSLVAVLTLALGIGANTAIFSVVNTVLLRPLPFPGSERLVTVTLRTQQGDSPTAVSPLMYQYWLENNQSFEAFAANMDGSFNVSTDVGPQLVEGSQVTSEFFRAIGVQPFIGRGFLPEEEHQGTSQVLVLSYSLWQRYYGGTMDIIGRRVVVDDKDYTVVGVLPEGFRFAGSVRAVYPAMTVVPDTKDRGLNYEVVARLKPGITIEAARMDMDRVYRQFVAAYPDHTPRNSIGIGLIPYRDAVTADGRPLLNILGAAVGAVLLIACANVANLLLSRSAVRRKEIAIRSALGAGAARILRQLIIESLALSSIAAVVGVGLAFWGVALLHTMSTQLNPLAGTASIDFRALVFSAILSLATALMFGTSGALQARTIDTQKALRSETMGRGRERKGFSNALVVLEMALATLLLVTASLLIITFYRLQRIDFGFNTDNLVAAELPLSSEKYKSAATVDRFEQELREHIRAIPGVLSVATASGAPLVRTYNHVASIMGQPESQPLLIEYRAVSPEYFQTLGIAVSSGRYFLATDARNSPPVALINQTFARRFPPGVDPIGQRLIVAKGSPQEEAPREIVGIVANVSDRPPGSPVTATVYVPRSQVSDQINQSVNSFFYSACLIRTAPGNDVGRGVRESLAALDPQMPIAHVRTIREIMAASIGEQRFGMLLMSVFAAIAVALTIVGLYGVLSYQVVQRTREIGLRIALGDTRSHVLVTVLREGAGLAGLGIAIGLAMASGLGRFLESLLYGVTPTDSRTYIAISALLAAVALLASYIPARRATKIDPLVALKYE